MSNPAKLIFTSGLVLLLYPALQGQEKLSVPDAQAILKKTREVYSRLNSYHFVHEILVESKKQGEKAFKPIGQIQMEAASEQAERAGPPVLPLNSDRCRLLAKSDREGTLLVIGDNQATLFTQSKKEYMQGTSLSSISTSVGGSMMLSIFLTPFEILNEDGIKEAKVVRSEKVLVDKQEHDCYVIEGVRQPPARFDLEQPPKKVVLGFDFQLMMISGFLPAEFVGMYSLAEKNHGGAFTLWIDQKTHLMLKSKTRASVLLHSEKSIGDKNGLELQVTDTFTKATINTALPKELFQFKAPAGSKQIRNEREGILVGAQDFKSTKVSPLVGWVQGGIYDAKEGFEIAVLQHDKITFLNPTTYAVKRTVAIDDFHLSGKQLVSLRADGNLNLIAGGGGFSDVGLAKLNGELLWRFKPGDSPPTKMIATDLDGDGNKEFYVADYEGVSRLDKNGKLVWRTTSKMNFYLFTLPSEGKRPAAVVTENGMWDCHGKSLQEGIKSSVGTYKLQPVKWGDAFCLASGQTSSEGGHVFVFDLTGKTLFKQSIGDWGVNQILAVRFKPREAPHLVVVGGRGGGSTLMELNIFAHDGTLVFREIRKGETLVVIPNDATGMDTLLLCTGGIKKLEKR
jgi:hypothetical protein